MTSDYEIWQDREGRWWMVYFDGEDMHRYPEPSPSKSAAQMAICVLQRLGPPSFWPVVENIDKAMEE